MPVEVQRSMAGQNADVPQDLRIKFRIGIHVGDIIIDDNDIFGDGVNIAARSNRCSPEIVGLNWQLTSVNARGQYPAPDSRPICPVRQ